MKYVSILLVVALLSSMVGVGYLYITSRVVVEATGVSIIEATAEETLFEQIRQQVNQGHAIGTAFANEIRGEVSDYVFLTARLTLRNDCYIDAEMVELQIVPQSTDIMQIGAVEMAGLPAHTEDTFEATILSTSHSSAVREVLITYYMWGRPFTQKVTVRSSTYQQAT